MPFNSNQLWKGKPGQIKLEYALFGGLLVLLVILVGAYLVFFSSPAPPDNGTALIVSAEILSAPIEVFVGDPVNVSWKISSNKTLTAESTAVYLWHSTTASAFEEGISPQALGFEEKLVPTGSRGLSIPGTFSASTVAQQSFETVYLRAHVFVDGKNYWSAEKPVKINEGEDGEFEDPPKWEGEQLNFIVIYTDDQRADTLWAMPNLQEELIQKGVYFPNAFITNPLCCPSRASFLSGGFNSYNTHVLTNQKPNGNAVAFFDEGTLPVMLQEKGYKTAMIGKYLNGYAAIKPRIPPGWTIFIEPEGSWTQYRVFEGSSTPDEPGVGVQRPEDTYLTYFLRDEALEFIEENSASPFFIYLAPKAPHGPATPAPEDEGLFSDYVFESPSVPETDLSDKPAYIQENADGDEEEEDDEGPGGRGIEFFRDQLRSLQPVDRMIQEIVDKLEEKNLLDKTVIVFAGDNGYMWGEHGFFAKQKPYEESVKVPLVVRMPNAPSRIDNHVVAVNLDVPTMILKLAGIEKQTDGLDMYGLVAGANIQWRDGLALQAWRNNPESIAFTVPFWVAWRTEKYKYIEYDTGEKELYDLSVDPFELESLHANPAYTDTIEGFSQKLKPLTGMYISFSKAPAGSVGENYSFDLKAVAGKPPYHWALTDLEPFVGVKEKKFVDCFKRLPEGLELSEDGTITGVPTTQEYCAVGVEVLDSSVSPQDGLPQRYRYSVKIEIK